MPHSTIEKRRAYWKRRRATPEFKAKKRVWSKGEYKRNRTKKLAYHKQRQLTHAEDYHAYHIKRCYNLSKEDYEKRRAKYNGLCILCLREKTAKERLCVDHDHTTKQVRGLLCRRCNAALAMLGDTAERIERVLSYLKGEL